MADDQLAKNYGDLWDRIASVVDRRRVHEPRVRFQTPDGSPVLGVVVAIVRMCDPAESEAHRHEARQTIEMWSGGSISPNGVFIAYCLDHLVRARTWLPDNDPFVTGVLGGQRAAADWEATAGDDAWNDPSWLGHPEPRKALVKSGWEGIQKSEDPLVAAARELVSLMRENERIDEELDAEEDSLRADIGRALLESYGTQVSPDGTETARFTDGVVRGFRWATRWRRAARRFAVSMLATPSSTTNTHSTSRPSGSTAETNST